MRKVKNKKGGVNQQYLVEIILAGLIITLFLFATMQKSDSRYVKQQIIEKQTALLIESASPGMSFTLNKANQNGFINNIKIENGRIFTNVEGLKSIKGYPYFSKYTILVKQENDKFIIEVKEWTKKQQLEKEY